MAANNCPCANYYTCHPCTNTVSKFGDLCKLCMTAQSGRPLSPGKIPDHALFMSQLPDMDSSVSPSTAHPKSAGDYTGAKSSGWFNWASYSKQ